MRRALPFAIVLMAYALPAAAQVVPNWVEVQGGTWSVPPEVVNDVAGRVQEAANKAPWGGRPVPDVDAFQVQYQGTRIDGKRIVRMVGSCRIAPGAPDMKQHWYIVNDGGNCYYSAQYDPAAQAIVYFRFNGR